MIDFTIMQGVIFIEHGLEEAKCIASSRLCDAYGCTGIGGRSENQDAYGGICNDENIILTVCDGMGGMNGGQTASRIACNEIVQSLSTVPKGQMNVDALKQAVAKANTSIYQRAMEEPSLRGMGTTATVVVINSTAAYITHVGDSRIYQLRKGKKIFRTFDHSKVFEMVARKMMTEEQARQSSFSNIITRALGIRPEVEMEVEILPYKKGDRFILCCDGVWNTLPESEIITLFNSNENVKEEVFGLLERVDAIGVENGANHDNLTAIVADVKANSKYQYSWLKKIKRRLKK